MSYLLQLWRGNTQGVLVTALLGGVYSSTSTTVALSRRGREEPAQARMTAGAIILATGVMYIRLIVLISLFAPGLARALGWPFAAMAILALAMGGFWIRRQRPKETARLSLRNPLQLRHALIFAALFVGIQVITRLTLQGLGDAGLYTLAGIMGLTDIDPFILSLTQQTTLAIRQGALAVGFTVASNNLFKGAYAWRVGGADVGRRALPGLALLGALTIAVIAGFVR
jgi:uncharacterized membrane protein (DUF4010 family)